MTKATVAYLLKGKAKKQKILLGIKTKKICRNKLNGPGGKNKKRESYRKCVLRETQEEIGVRISPKHLRLVAMIDFADLQKNGSYKVTYRVAFYLVRKWKGKIKSNGDLKNLRWYNLKSLPLKRMMLGHPEWFQEAISGHFVRSRINYGQKRRRVDSFTTFERKPAK
jgi:ADP-ribose pyrophosphatase YjhB (NUDIX family)